MSEPQSTPADDAVSRELHELATAVAELKAEVRRTGAALPREETAGWDDAAPSEVTHGWVSSLAPSRQQRLRIPRLPFELAFLAGAAVLAGLADLKPVEIAVVMGIAWIIVALAEWAGSRGDRLRVQISLSSPAAPAAPPAPASPDPTWFTPPVEHTLLGARAEEEQATGVAQLPPVEDPEATGVAQLPPVEDPETTAEHRVGS
jgi:hypothetical protein